MPPRVCGHFPTPPTSNGYYYLSIYSGLTGKQWCFSAVCVLFVSCLLCHISGVFLICEGTITSNVTVPYSTVTIGFSPTEGLERIQASQRSSALFPQHLTSFVVLLLVSQCVIVELKLHCEGDGIPGDLA